MQITKIVSCHTADFKPVKQEVNGTVILPPFSIPWTNTLAYFSLSTTENKEFNGVLLQLERRQFEDEYQDLRNKKEAVAQWEAQISEIINW